MTRYADSDGLESDADRPNAYHYRDFVIRAFNDDLCYQDTTFDEARAKVDPENRLLWQRRPLRLLSEVSRDAVLAVSGTLNLKQFGYRQGGSTSHWIRVD